MTIEEATLIIISVFIETIRNLAPVIGILCGFHLLVSWIMAILFRPARG